MRKKENAGAVSASEAKSLFADLESSPGLVLAVSGGPDSTALLWLATRWAKTLKKRPKLLAVTVDHGLRKEAKREAAEVGRLAKALGIAHRIVRWSGSKPKTAIQQTARQARYALLVEAAKAAGAQHIVTAHTLDDQAETVLMRMARGSGIAGLGGMARRSRLDGLVLVRPFLDIPKMRLIATLKSAKVPYAVDPSNTDPRFTRARLRPLMTPLAGEGLDARRLAILAARLRRAEAALEAEVDRVSVALPVEVPEQGAITFPAAGFARLPAEIALRLLGRAVGRRASEGPVELGKLEVLLAATLAAAQKPQKAPFRRTLAGALVSVTGDKVRIETAPARKKPSAARRPAVLTKRGGRAGTAAGMR
jgi:tRNA(Ile)-lysidine synthase